MDRRSRVSLKPSRSAIRAKERYLAEMMKAKTMMLKETIERGRKNEDKRQRRMKHCKSEGERQRLHQMYEVSNRKTCGCGLGLVPVSPLVSAARLAQ